MKERDIHVGDIVEKQENTGWVHEHLVIYKQPDYAVTLRLTQEKALHNENPVMVGVQYTDAGKVGYIHYNEMLRISWHIPEEDVKRVKNKVRLAIGLDEVNVSTRIQELKEDLRLKDAIIGSLEKEIARLKEDVAFYREALTVKTASEPKKKKGLFAFFRKKVLA